MYQIVSNGWPSEYQKEALFTSKEKALKVIEEDLKTSYDPLNLVEYDTETDVDGQLQKPITIYIPV